MTEKYKHFLRCPTCGDAAEIDNVPKGYFPVLISCACKNDPAVRRFSFDIRPDYERRFLDAGTAFLRAFQNFKAEVYRVMARRRESGP